MHRRILAFLVVAVAGALVLAGADLVSVDVTVIDKTDSAGEGVEGAEVELADSDGKAFSDFTDESGSVNLSVPAGDYTLRVSASGYRVAAKRVRVTRNGGTFRIKLNPAD